jgi:hypothetical protein
MSEKRPPVMTMKGCCDGLLLLLLLQRVPTEKFPS